jgi:Spy/CpxP family protein refolding chaperone
MAAGSWPMVTPRSVTEQDARVTVGNKHRQFRVLKQTKAKRRLDYYMETRSLFRKLFAQVLGLLLLLSSGSLPAMAQDDNSNPGPSPTPGNSQPQAPAAGKMQNPEKMKKRRLAHLEKITQLTPDQQTKVTPIISDYVDQLITVKNDGSLQPEAKQAKQKELRKKFTQEVKAILTPQQRQALRNASKNKQQQGKGSSQNGNAEEDQFEQGSNQPGPGI